MDYDLKDLDGLPEVGGYPITIMDNLRVTYPERFTETGAMDHKWFEETIRPTKHVYIREDKNSISFTLKRGDEPGCDPLAMVDAARALLALHHDNVTAENRDARHSFDFALWYLRKAGEAIKRFHALNG